MSETNKENILPSFPIKIFNTGETAEQLKLNYNPEGSKLRKMQYRMLDMLLYIDKVCKDLDIRWRLDGGNILGAVRHGGFIPWDDDVDIVLVPSEFKRLVNYLIDHPHPQFKLQCNKTDKGYYSQGWAVLRDTKSKYIQDTWVHKARKYKGAQVDIFQYENHINKQLYKISLISSGINKKYFIGRYPVIAQGIFYWEKYIQNPLLKIIGYPFSSKHIYSHSWGVFCRYLPENILMPYKPIVFEGHIFPGPNNVESFLKLKYGENYLDLPPKEKRNWHQADYEIWD